MLKAYKVELNPKPQQKQKISQSIGICRWLYNQYLAKNKWLYELFKQGKIDKREAFMSAIDFDKYVNNEIKIQDEFKWIDDCGSKARKKAICNAEIAFKKFFKGSSEFPRFKKKKNQNVKAYFPKNAENDWLRDRHWIQIPTIGKVRLKEKGYIPVNVVVKSGTVSCTAGKYYVSVLCEILDYNDYSIPEDKGCGIDLGIKDLAIVSNIEKPFKNINKTKRVKKLEKKLKKEQRKLSRRYESLKLRNKKEKGEATRQNIQKQIAKVQKLHKKLADIRQNYINKVVSVIIEQKPSFITIEDLNVSGLMKNRHLSKAVAEQKFYEFRRVLTYKCKWNNIELRIVDRFFPSSKMCSCCGTIKKDLKLKDRIYKCDNCNTKIDRDKNASINLENAKIYKVA